MLSYAFNHAEAARSFSESIRLDSSCAMCYWGYALVLGPNYNVGMEKDNIVHAYRVAQQALALSNDLTEKERMLIMAITMRYDSVPAVDRSWNDETYAFTMGGLYQVYPDDPDIGALYAEALLNQHPRDLWNQDGTPKTWTTEIVKVLENVISKNPKHPGANHFYILAVETSLTPERAMPSADLLRELVPVSHLLHMPSHIYIRTGRYHDGTLANQKALEVDNEYISACHAQGVYPLAYFPHMLHFMAATATLEGDQTTAILASRKLREQLDKNLLGDSDRGTLQNYYSIFYFVMLKFGLWDEILKEPPPDADLPYPRAILEYVKGMAAIAKKDIVTAQKHLIELEKYLKDSAALSINLRRMKSENDLMTIAHHVLRGEMLNQEGKVLEGIEQLNKY